MRGSRETRRGGRAEEDPRAARQVNTLLSTLRGEQYRHSQNLLQRQENKRIVRASSSLAHNKPTLPLAQIFGTARDEDEEPSVGIQPAPFRAPGQPRRNAMRPPVTLIEGVPTYMYPDGAVPGPKPPKSWSALFNTKEDETVWRADVLSLLYAHLPSSASYFQTGSDEGEEDGEERADSVHVQPLTLICTRTLLETCESAEELAEVAVCVPAHLRRDLMRWTAVHCPLSTSRLRALCLDEGHAAGELIVVGPQATVRADLLGRGRAHVAENEVQDYEGGGPVRVETVGASDWEEETHADVRLSMTVLVVLACPLSVNTLLSFPRTLTHLALLKLPHPVPMRHLPRTCPNIEVLDLSYNAWLKADATPSGMSYGPETMYINMLEWARWASLRVLGLRECGIGREILSKVNKGRWADVEVIGVDPSLHIQLTGSRSNREQSS